MILIITGVYLYYRIFRKYLKNTCYSNNFNINNTFFNGLHGLDLAPFEWNGAPQTTPDLNKTKANKGIALLHFIDFRKAFYFVDSTILLRKLFHYGFDNDSIRNKELAFLLISSANFL